MTDEKAPAPPEKKHFRRKPALILAAGAVLFFLWLGLWSYGAQYWPEFRPLLPPSLYFRVEEILALNDRNSPLSLIGVCLITSGFLIWAIRANGRKLRIREGALPGLIVVLLLLFWLPGLRAPLEKVRRLKCTSGMKWAWLELRVKHPDKLPDKLPDEVDTLLRKKHVMIRYHGAGRNWKEPRFILFEDEGRCHAGELRHRLWSDGKVESWYPWKEAKK